MHTWCAWDTLFLPALLGETAEVRSTCPVTGSVVELVVAPDAVKGAPAALWCRSRLWRPRTRPTSPARSVVTSSSSRAAAARKWRQTRADDLVFGVDAAFEPGRRAVMALLEPGSSPVTAVRR